MLHNNSANTFTGIGFVNKAIFINKHDTRLYLLTFLL